MDPKKLLVLYDVALHGSIVAAARALSLTPSAVSQQLSALEREVGIALLEPHGRGVRLTDAAHALLGPADAIRTELTRAEIALHAVKEAHSGSLALGAFPTSGTHLIPAALERFAPLYPDVGLRLIELEPEQSLPLLHRGELDLAVAFECDLVPVATMKVEHETLFTEPMLLAHAQDRREAHRIRLDRLANERWIAPIVGTSIHEFTRRACQAAGFEPQITSIWTDFQVVQSLAAQGLGLAFVPSLALAPPRAEVAISHSRPAYSRRVFAAWRPGTSREPLITALVKALHSAGKDVTRASLR